jgi:hypothetical protein
MKARREVLLQIYSLNLGAIWRWPTPGSGRFTPGNEPRYPSKKRLFGPPKDGLYYTQIGKKISCPCQDTNRESYIPVPSHNTDYAVLATVKLKISEAGLHKTRAASRRGEWILYAGP